MSCIATCVIHCYLRHINTAFSSRRGAKQNRSPTHLTYSQHTPFSAHYTISTHQTNTLTFLLSPCSSRRCDSPRRKTWTRLPRSSSRPCRTTSPGHIDSPTAPSTPKTTGTITETFSAASFLQSTTTGQSWLSRFWMMPRRGASSRFRCGTFPMSTSGFMGLYTSRTLVSAHPLQPVNARN